MQPNGHGYVFINGHPHAQTQWQYPPPQQQMSPFPPQQPFQHHPHPHQPQQHAHLPQPPFANQSSPQSHSQQWAPTSSSSVQQGPPPQNGFPPPPPHLAQAHPHYPPLPPLPTAPHFPPHSQHAPSFLTATAPSTPAPHPSVHRDQAASSPFTPIEALLHTLQAQPLPASIQHSNRNEQPQQQHSLLSLHSYPYENGFPVMPPLADAASARPPPGPPPPPPPPPPSATEAHEPAQAQAHEAADGDDASLEAQQRAFLVRACGAPPPLQGARATSSRARGARMRKWHAFCEAIRQGVLEAEREGRVGALPAAPPSAAEGAARPRLGSVKHESRDGEAQRGRARGSAGAVGEGCCEGKVQCAAPVSSERDRPRPSPAPALAAAAADAAVAAVEECCGGLIDCSGPLFDDTPSYPSSSALAAGPALDADNAPDSTADEADPDVEGDVDTDAVADSAAAAAYDDAPRWPNPAPSYMPLAEAFALLEPYMADPCPPSSPPPRPSSSLSTSPTSPSSSAAAAAADLEPDTSAWGVAPEKLATMLWDTYPSWIAPPGLELPDGAGRDPPHFAIAPAPGASSSEAQGSGPGAGEGAGEGEGGAPARCDALYVWRWCVDMSARGLAVRDLVVRGVCGEDEAKRRVFDGRDVVRGEGKVGSERREGEQEEGGERAGLGGGRGRGAGSKCGGRC